MADNLRIPNYLLLQAELEIHRSGAKKAKAKEGWMNREGGGFPGNGGGASPPVKHEEKEQNRQEEMSKREVDSLVRETKPQMSRTATEQEKMGNSSVLPPLSREQKMVAAIGPPPVAQVAPIPRVLQVLLLSHACLNHCLSIGPPSNHGAHTTPAVNPNRYSSIHALDPS